MVPKQIDRIGKSIHSQETRMKTSIDPLWPMTVWLLISRRWFVIAAATRSIVFGIFVDAFNSFWIHFDLSSHISKSVFRKKPFSKTRWNTPNNFNSIDSQRVRVPPCMFCMGWLLWTKIKSLLEWSENVNVYDDANFSGEFRSETLPFKSL